MTNRTSTGFAGLAAAILASLVIVSTADARPTGLSPDRADKLGVVKPVTNTVPDRADRLGVINEGPISVPDRVDQLGTANGPGPVAVASVPASSSDSFDWATAPLIAAALFAVALLAAVASLVARKRSRPAALAS
jgi:hypothetical protein